MATMRIIGIDPGAEGAVALFVDGRFASVVDMPCVANAKGRPRVDGAAVGALLRELAPGHAFVERVGAMPGQGVTSMFTFGMAAGIVWGALGALQVPISPVGPAQWKSALRVPAAKNGARARASQLLPEGAPLWPLVKHDGRAEAALIGLYGVTVDGGAILW